MIAQCSPFLVGLKLAPEYHIGIVLSLIRSMNFKLFCGFGGQKISRNFTFPSAGAIEKRCSIFPRFVEDKIKFYFSSRHGARISKYVWRLLLLHCNWHLSLCDYLQFCLRETHQRLSPSKIQNNSHSKQIIWFNENKIFF